MALAYRCQSNKMVQILNAQSQSPPRTQLAMASIPVATVNIEITNVDEKPTFSTVAPAIGMKMISRDEGMTALAEQDDVANVTYSAMDPDGLQVNLTLMGDDGAKFQLTSSDGGGVPLLRREARLRDADGQEQGQRVRGDGAGLGRHDVRRPHGHGHRHGR